jgi:hypothetical protein
MVPTAPRLGDAIDGKIVLPPKLRADARLQPGDTLDVHAHNQPLASYLPTGNFGLAAFNLNSAIGCEQQRREDAKKALGNGKFGSDFAFTCQGGQTLVKRQALPCFPPSRVRVFAVKLRHPGSRACGSRTAIGAGPNATWPATPSTKGAKTRRKRRETASSGAVVHSPVR